VPLASWRKLWELRRPFAWYCGGYGSGKSTFGVFEAALNALVRHPGRVGIVCAPTHALLWQSWFTEWKKWFTPFAGLWTLHQSSKTGDEIRFTNGSVILLRSTSSPASNEGINAAWVIFDEATREPTHDSFRVLSARVRRPYPGRMGTVLLCGPPATRSHWSAVEFGYGPGTVQIDKRTVTFEGDATSWHTDDHVVVRSRTRDNHLLPEGYERAQRNQPGATAAWCAQYLDAEFGVVDGAVWPQFHRARHVVPAASLAGRKWRKVIVGVDWGFSHPGTMIVLGIDAHGDAWVLAEEVHARTLVDDSPDGWGPIARALVEKWGATEFHCDPSRPGDMLALSKCVRRAGARVYPANNDVGEGIRRVGARFEAVGEDRAKRTESINGIEMPVEQPALWVSDACPKLIACIEGYGYRRVRGVLTEAPQEVKDDEADGLRYAVAAIA
jgi:phage terminase large subunit